MEKMLDLITGEVTKAFTACGYDEKYGKSDTFKPPGSVRVPV